VRSTTSVEQGIRLRRRIVRTLARVAATVTVATLQPPVLGVQWLKYPTPRVPRTTTGAPNLNAPAPRTADGKPDFSGTWDIEHNIGCPRDGCADMNVGHEFINIGWGLKGGLPYRPWAAALAKKRTEELRKEDPTSFCLPIGIVRLHTMALLKKIIQVPGLLVILNEHNATYRQIFTDGRPLPKLSETEPAWLGYSVGRWEGDDFLVESIGFRDHGWLSANMAWPNSDALHVIERWHRRDFGHLEETVTIDDPKAYLKPWTNKVVLTLQADTELLDSYCDNQSIMQAHYSMGPRPEEPASPALPGK